MQPLTIQRMMEKKKDVERTQRKKKSERNVRELAAHCNHTLLFLYDFVSSSFNFFCFSFCFEIVSALYLSARMHLLILMCKEYCIHFICIDKLYLNSTCETPDAVADSSNISCTAKYFVVSWCFFEYHLTCLLRNICRYYVRVSCIYMYVWHTSDCQCTFDRNIIIDKSNCCTQSRNHRQRHQ